MPVLTIKMMCDILIKAGSVISDRVVRVAISLWLSPESTLFAAAT